MSSKLISGHKWHPSNHNDQSFPKKKRSKLSMKTKITDVNSDCLEKIFEYLDIDDLLHVADSNKWLQISAGSVFCHKFGQQKVQLTDIYPKYGAVFQRDGTIVVGGLKTCLQLLRCFGEFVKNLDISFVDSTKKHHFLMDQYINEFCADSLIELRVYGRLTSLMKDVKKPFSATESICFEECALNTKLTHFNEWFPRLRHLVLFTNFLNPICIEVAFPYLEHFATEINQGRSTDIGKDNIAKALCKNPQLRSLHIRVDTAQKMEFDDFITVISKNPSIEKLQTHWYYAHSIFNSHILSKISKALPSLTELRFTGLVFEINEIVRFMDQSKLLKRFSFALHSKYPYRLLQDRLGDTWKMSRNQSYLITLER